MRQFLFGKVTFIFVILALMSGCKSNPDVTFGAEPETINEGEVSALTWSVVYEEAATEIAVAIEPGLGTVDATGVLEVSPTETTEYTLTTTAIIEEALKTTTKTVTVTVIEAPRVPEITGFDFYRGDTRAGEPVHLIWGVQGAESISISPEIGVVDLFEHEIVVNPMADTVYTLTAENGEGTVTAEISVDVTFSDLDLTYHHPEAFKECIAEAAEENNWQFNEQVTEIRCIDKGMDHFSGLTQFNNLRVLDLSGNRLSEGYINLSWTSEPRLEELNLEGNALKDFTEFRELTALTHLNVAGNPVVDDASLWALIENNPGLGILVLRDIPLNSAYWGLPLVNLESLDVENTGLRDIGFMSAFSSLKEIKAGYNAIRDLSPLSMLPLIESLDVSDNQLQLLNGIEHLTQLVSLDVSQNPNLAISDIALILNANATLTSLGLAGIPIKSLDQLGSIFGGAGEIPAASYGLHSLNVNDVQVTDFTPVNLHPALQSLSFGNNTVNQFPDFSQFSSLVSLDVNNTGLGDYGLIASLAGTLTSLNVSNNPLSVDFPFSMYTGLTSLEVEGLGLASILGVEQLTSLEILNIANNQLELEAVFNTLVNPHLRNIDVSGNEGMIFPDLYVKQWPLETLNVADTGIDGINLTAWPQLKHLNISGNSRLTTWDAYGIDVLHLETLNISGTNISALDVDRRYLTSLDVSDSATEYYQLHDVLSSAERLENLYVGSLKDTSETSSQFYSLVSAITHPLRIKKLDVSGLRLNDLTDVDAFENLRWLNAKGNHFSSIPLPIQSLLALKYIDISATRLGAITVPESVEELRLSGNPRLMQTNLALINTLTRLEVSENIAMQFGDIRSAIENSDALQFVDVSALNVEVLSEVLPGIPDLSSLLSLNLSENHLVSLQELSSLTELKRLIISDNPIMDLSFVGSMLNLKNLDLGDTLVTDVSIISALSNLESLSLRGMSITDPTSLLIQLSALERLQSLNLSGINLQDSDLNLIGNLPLSSLYLSGTNRVEVDVSPWPTLAVLDVSNNPISYLAGLPDGIRELYLTNNTLLDYLSADLQNIEVLDVNYSGIEYDQVENWLVFSRKLRSLGMAGINVPAGFNVGSLVDSLGENRDSLKSLDISDLSIESFIDLEFLPKLEQLFARNSVFGLYPVSSSNLTHLDVSGSIFYDPNDLVTFLDNSPGLSVLGLNDVDLSAVDIFSMLSSMGIQLEELNISRSNIENWNIADEDLFGNLRRLELAGNALDSIPTALVVPTLQWLDISNNRLRDIEFLPVNMRVLKAGNNPIGEVAGLDFLRWLTVLSLPNTNITSIPYLSSFPQLQEVDLSNTDISNAQQLLVELGYLSQLRVLRLAGLDLFNLHGNTTFEVMLPNLTELDLSDTGLMDLESTHYPLLKVLNISRNPIDGVWSNDNIKLVSLDLSHTFFTYIPFKMDAIEHLFVNYSQIDADTVMNAITQSFVPIKSLGIAGLKRDNDNWMNRFSSQEHYLTQLEYLDISNMKVVDISWIADYDNLRVLNASGNFIEYVSHYGSFAEANLESVDFSGNVSLLPEQVESLLMNNPKLTSIGLNDISLGAVDVFSILDQYNEANIVELKLSHTNLQHWNIPSPEKYSRLETLELSNNGLMTVPDALLVPTLVSLDLSDNELNNAGFLYGLEEKLTVLNLSGNPMNDTFELMNYLSLMEGIRELGLAGIPNLPNLNEWVDTLGLTHLDLSNTGLDTFDAQEFGRLRSLKLADNHLEYIDLYSFSFLRNLDLANNRISDSNFVSYLPYGIERLNLSNNRRLSDVDQVIHMPFIRELRLSGLHFDDENLFSNFQHKDQLRVLDISNTNIQQFQYWDFDYLVELNLSDTILINPFFSLDYESSIEKLYLKNANIEEISLYGSRFIREIDLSGYPISDVTLLGLELFNVQSLALNNVDNPNILQQISSIFTYGYFERALKNLELGGNGITDSSELSAYVNLESLNLRDNALTSVSEVSGLPYLTDIDVYNNAIVDLSVILQSTAWHSIDIGNNPGLTRFMVDEVLQMNPNINVLGVHGADLSEGDFVLPELPRLSKLDIGNTGITSLVFDGSAMWSLLQSLNISDNAISELPLSNHIRELDISNAGRTSVYDLTHLIGLTSLNVSGNAAVPVADIKMILDNSSNIVSVDVSGISLFSIDELISPIVAGNSYPLANLNLSNTGVQSLHGLYQFDTLRLLDVSGNADLDCTEIDGLYIPGLTVIRPGHCSL